MIKNVSTYDPPDGGPTIVHNCYTPETEEEKEAIKALIKRKWPGDSPFGAYANDGSFLMMNAANGITLKELLNPVTTAAT